MLRTFVSSIAERALSIPIFFKVLGIGGVVAVLFGSLTLVQTQAGASQFLYRLLEQGSLSTAHMVVDTMEAHGGTADIAGIMEHLRDVRLELPEVRYIVVLDREEGILGSTPAGNIPPGLQRDFPPPNRFECALRTVSGHEGRLVEVRCPVAGIGSVQLGFADAMVVQRLAALRGTILRALAWCLVLGAVLALFLTHLLTRPIHQLVESARRIRDGEFDARAKVFSNDEVGRLAVAFNQMAEGLGQYRLEVQAKEKARLSLIESVVQAQENERKSISRELHDHLGQSLLALLLQVQSGHATTGPADSHTQSIEQSIRGLIDEVRRLAGGMRPSILDDYGLDSALARHAEEVARLSGLKVGYQCTCPPGMGRLPLAVEVPLFRVAQEALANVVWHAHATHASVILLRHSHDVTLLVEDDGAGFEPAAVREHSDRCLGLVGMQERAALLGGDFLVQSVPGQGTTIRVRVPLSEDADADTNPDRG